MAERDLKEAEELLWQELDLARARQRIFAENDDVRYTPKFEPAKLSIDNRRAMAEMVQAIVAVRRERRVEEFLAEQRNIVDEIEAGTRNTVSINKPLKLTT